MERAALASLTIAVAVWAVHPLVDDWTQVVNGAAAVVGIAAAQYAFTRVTPHSPLAFGVHTANLTLLVWYASINLGLGFGVLDFEARLLTPLFRYAFAPLLLTVAARQWIAAARTVTL